MSFVPTQVRKLKAKLKPHHVKSREADGLSLHYLEGWHVMAEANRIFGFDGWDRETVSSTAVWTKQVGTRYCAAYVTRIRITVRAGEHKISREGCGAGESNAASPGQAHEFAAKAAETDATKRALSTFGNAFGLSLYGGAAEVRAEARRQADQREQVSGVNVAPPSAKSEVDQPTQSSRTAGTAIAPSHAHTPTFRDEGAPDIASATNASETASAEPDAERVVSGGTPPTVPVALGPNGSTSTLPPWPEISPLDEAALRAQQRPGRIDKSRLEISEPSRLRDHAHLAFVASRSCLICGRNRAQAHHLKFMQPTALGRKVSDEFTVPLCSIHHRELHQTGAELLWWQAQGIDPEPVARELWRESRSRGAAAAAATQRG